MRLDDRVCSGYFAVEQGLHQGCVLAPLLFNIFFAAVINMAYTCFKVHKNIIDALVYLRNKKRVGGRGESTAGEPVPAAAFWGILSADDAGVVSRPPEQPRKMMGAIVVVCSAFGLAVSEAKTEIMCVQLTSSRVRLGQSFKTVGYGSASCWGDLGAGSVETDVFYIPFIVSVQYIGY